MSRFIILGAAGVLGTNLAFSLKARGHSIHEITRRDFDVTNEKYLTKYLNEIGKATVLNCIGYLPADKCEENPILSEQLNLEFPNKLAKITSEIRKLQLIHFSTDFIFDGQTNTPYQENSVAHPVNIYGKHKLESEKAVLSHLQERVRIVRFASLIAKSPQKKTFIEKIVEKARAGEQISLVNDLQISMATPELLTIVCEKVFSFDKPIVHAVHNGTTTWLDIAQKTLEYLDIKTEIKAVASSTFRTAAARPMFSALKPTNEIMNFDSRKWETALKDFLSQNHL